MRLEKCNILFLMKFTSVLFLIYMLSKASRVFYCLSKETLSEESNNLIKEIYDEDVCNKYWLFHMMAFVLGAFWNVKKIIKAGVI